MRTLKTPDWIRNLSRQISVSRLVVLDGNTKDQYVLPDGAGIRRLWLPELFAHVCAELDPTYETVHISPNRVEGRSAPAFEQLNSNVFALLKEPVPRTLDAIRNTVETAKAPFAIFLDALDFLHATPEDEAFGFALLRILDRLNRSSRRHVLAIAAPGLSSLPAALRQNLPGAVTLSIPLPDLAERQAVALHHVLEHRPATAGSAHKLTVDQEMALESWTNEIGAACTGMHLVGLDALLARLPLDAHTVLSIQQHRAGIVDDPWEQFDRRRLQDLDARLRKEIFGQETAIARVASKVRRATSILSTARFQGGDPSPRLRMVFVGPSGVGKTECAKEITRLVYGDPSFMLRVDCSEFQSAESMWALTGSPPGFVSTQEGGRVTNAMLERPSRLVLFDEFERASPAFYALFLQILSDGRLSDSHGRMTNWSFASIVLTSNLGLAEASAALASGASPERVHEIYVAAVRNFFVANGLSPVWERIGEQSVIPFDDLRPEALDQVLDKGIQRILLPLERLKRTRIRLQEPVRRHLHDGLGSIRANGHAVRNFIESEFLEAFDGDLTPYEGKTVDVVDVMVRPGQPTRFILKSGSDGGAA